MTYTKKNAWLALLSKPVNNGRASFVRLYACVCMHIQRRMMMTWDSLFSSGRKKDRGFGVTKNCVFTPKTRSFFYHCLKAGDLTKHHFLLPFIPSKNYFVLKISENFNHSPRFAIADCTKIGDVTTGRWFRSPLWPGFSDLCTTKPGQL